MQTLSSPIPQRIAQYESEADRLRRIKKGLKRTAEEISVACDPLEGTKHMSVFVICRPKAVMNERRSRARRDCVETPGASITICSKMPQLGLGA